MHTCSVVAAVAAALTLAHGGAAAAPVYDPGTGSWYDYVNQDASGAFTNWTWLEARDDATTRTWMGRTGHLVTITSLEEENVLITNWFADVLYGQPHIGLFRDPVSDRATGWQWVTGEAFQYSNWFSLPGDVEPNDPSVPARDVYVHYRSRNVASTTSFDGYGWNDMRDERRGYFIEYSAVPAPGVAALVGLGLAGLAAGTRRRR